MDPYNSPRSQLVERPGPKRRGPVPLRVRFAVALVALDTVNITDLIFAFGRWKIDIADIFSTPDPSTMALFYALIVGMIVAIWFGQTWARWLYVPYALLCFFGALATPPLAEAIASHDAIALSDTATTLLSLVVIYLLFTGPSSAYFARRPSGQGS